MLFFEGIEHYPKKSDVKMSGNVTLENTFFEDSQGREIGRSNIVP